MTSNNTKEIDLLLLHLFLFFLPFSFLATFGPVYFYKLGIPLYGITLYWVFFFLVRLAFRPLAVFAAHRYGAKIPVIAATFIFSGVYLLYASLNGFNFKLLIIIFYHGAVSAFYWTLFHYIFAELSSLATTGRQTALRDITIHISSFLSPILSAIFVEYVGFVPAFILAACMSALSALPLTKLNISQFNLPELNLQRILATDKTGAVVYAGSGIFEFCHNYLWKIIIFIYLATNIKYGALISIIVALKIIISYTVGRFFDLGRGKAVAFLSLFILAITVIFRSYFPLSIPFIIGTDLAIILASLPPFTVVTAICYQKAKLSQPLWFSLLQESGWDLGVAFSLGVVSLLLYIGADLKPMILFGIAGLFMIAKILAKEFVKDSPVI